MSFWSYLKSGTQSSPQVFALDMNYKVIYFRTGVTRSDLTGKTWQEISLDEDLTVLHRLGLISEGSVCSCGDETAVCNLHATSQVFTTIIFA